MTNKQKWYVVAHQEDDAVWTISKDPETTGWETDGGLTKANAEELVNAANAMTDISAAAVEQLEQTITQYNLEERVEQLEKQVEELQHSLREINK